MNTGYIDNTVLLGTTIKRCDDIQVLKSADRLKTLLQDNFYAIYASLAFLRNIVYNGIKIGIKLIPILDY
jgi:hypothetical protein